MRTMSAFFERTFLLTILVLAFASPFKGHAQSNPSAESHGETSRADEVNRWTVGVAGGQLSGTFSRFAAELATALDDGKNLRVLPVVTYGATTNVSDLLYLKGIDVAITHADVFEEFKQRRNVSDIDQRVNYISQMYVSEMYLYVRPEIKSIQDLEGKTVGLHVKGAGQTTSGPILFERMGVKPNFVFVNNKIGLKKMETGEFSAIVHNGGKPNSLFANLQPKPGFKLLPIPFSEKFSDYYVPSSLGHEDYPNLFEEGESIETLGIPVVLAIYNWPRGSDRHRKVTRFIEYYFKRFDSMRKPPYHPKWKAINLAATVPGWTRYPYAQKMLDAMEAEAKTAQDPTARTTTAAEIARRLGIDGEEDQELFAEFLQWRRSQQN